MLKLPRPPAIWKLLLRRSTPATGYTLLTPTMDSADYVDVDTMLSYAGDFGRYQIILLFLFSIINAFSAFHYFGQTFISVIPEYICADAPLEKSSECSAVFILNETTIERPCENWIYNSSNAHGFVGIVQELNWVCKDSWKSAMGQSVFFVGSVVGSLFLGVLADRIGRLHVLVVSNMLAFFGNIITILSSNLVIFAISRFLAGCATDSNFVMMYIIVMEYIRPSMRTFGLNICIGIFYCASCMAVPWVAVLLGTWRSFLLFISVPHLTILLFYCLVPESAQWLISKGRPEEAITCFKRIARINNRKIDDKAFEALKQYCAEHVNPNQTHESFLGLLRTPKLRKKTIILVFKSMVMTLCYDAISRNVNGLSLSPFLIFTITSSTILPACLFILAVQDVAGRKALASGSLLLSGIFSIGSGIVQVFVIQPDPVLLVTLAVIARLGINVAYNSGAQYAVELIPTVVRGQGVSAIHVAGYAASFFSPQILFLGNLWKPSPEVILGVLLILGSLACLFLPETLNKTLPVTLDDGENFGENEKIFEFSCCKSRTESRITLTNNSATKYI